MKKELRFRYWDIPEKKMVYFNLWEAGEIPVKILRLYPVMRDTGLYDKNGKEIFQGDLMRHKKVIMEVAWSEDRARFVVRYHNSWKQQAHTPSLVFKSLQWAALREVVGNVHEGINTKE